MSYRIASFNIRDFGEISASETSSKVKDLDTIAKIIRENNIDIIDLSCGPCHRPAHSFCRGGKIVPGRDRPVPVFSRGTEDS